MFWDRRRLIPELYSGGGFTISSLNPALWLRAECNVFTNVAADLERSNTEYFDISDATNLRHDVGSFSYSLWYNPESGSLTQDIVGKWNPTGNNQEFILRYNSSNLITTVTSSDGSNSFVQNSGVTTSPGSWHHIVVRYNSTTNVLTQYINGSAVDYNSVAQPFGGTANLNIGARFAGVASFDGKLDSVGRWNRALTDTEMAWLYNSGSGRVYNDIASVGGDGANLDTDLIAWWDMDEKSGTRADSSGNGNNLTDNNTVTFGTGVSEGLAQDNNDGVSMWEDSTSNDNDFSSPAITNYPGLNVSGSIIGVDFDGSDDKMEASAIASLDGDNPFSIIAWVELDSTGEGSLGNILSDDAGGLTFRTDNVNATSTFGLVLGRATTDLEAYAASNTLTGSWQMLSITYDGGGTAAGVTTYLDDAESTKSSTTNGSGAFTSTTGLNLGNNDATSATLDGRLGQLIVVKSELLATDIANVYNATKGNYGL